MAFSFSTKYYAQASQPTLLPACTRSFISNFPFFLTWTAASAVRFFLFALSLIRLLHVGNWGRFCSFFSPLFLSRLLINIFKSLGTTGLWPSTRLLGRRRHSSIMHAQLFTYTHAHTIHISLRALAVIMHQSHTNVYETKLEIGEGHSGVNNFAGLCKSFYTFQTFKMSWSAHLLSSW